MRRHLLRLLAAQSGVRAYTKGPAAVARRAVRRNAHRALSKALRRL